MLPTGLPADRALFVAKSETEIVEILKTGHIRVGNGVLIFQRWSLETTKIVPELVSRPRWIKLWGLLLSKWTEMNFVETCWR